MPTDNALIFPELSTVATSGLVLDKVYVPEALTAIVPTLSSSISKEDLSKVIDYLKENK